MKRVACAASVGVVVASAGCVFLGIDGGPCRDASRCPAAFPVCHMTLVEAGRIECALTVRKDVVHDVDLRLDVDLPPALDGENVGVVISVQRNVHDGQHGDDGSDDVSFVLRDHPDRSRTFYFGALPGLPVGEDQAIEDANSVLHVLGGQHKLDVGGTVRVRVRAEGKAPTRLFAKVWSARDLEPAAWTVETKLAVDQFYTDADVIAVGLASAFTNGDGFNASFRKLVVYRASALLADDSFPVVTR